MGSLTRKFERKKNKDYKTLYETELNNRKLYEQRYKDIHDQYIELQIGSGLANLRKENMQLVNENQILKEEVARLKIELDDLKGFKEQDEQCIKALKEERRKEAEMEDMFNG